MKEQVNVDSPGQDRLLNLYPSTKLSKNAQYPIATPASIGTRAARGPARTAVISNLTATTPNVTYAISTRAATAQSSASPARNPMARAGSGDSNQRLRMARRRTSKITAIVPTTAAAAANMAVVKAAPAARDGAKTQWRKASAKQIAIH